MTISVGSYEDLEPRVDRPIDRNPSVPCDMCGESFNWMDYWKPRITKGDLDPQEKRWWCDSCWNDLRKKAELERTKRDHMQLSEFQT